MPISRSQMNRQLRMGGGIMQVAPRQGALFGGLKKAVSGVLGSAKDLLKSPLGKAALLYGGSKLLPMAFGQLGKAGGISELFSSVRKQKGTHQIISNNGVIWYCGT